MVLITPYMLQKKLAEVNVESRIGAVALQNKSNTNLGNQEVAGGWNLVEKQITQVQGDKMVTKDGIKAKLYNPMPGMKWYCRGVTGSQGFIALEKPLTGLFLTDGETSYCLGVNGDTDEFEVVIQVGKTEIRVSDLYLSMKSSLTVKNGLEAEL